MKKILMLAVLALGGFSYAHNGEATLADVQLGQSYEVIHNDADTGYGYKGTFSLTVTNSGTQPWGDFHFGINNGPGVVFGTGGGLYPTLNGNSVAYALSNNNTVLDLYFYGTPVNAGQQATFVVYTDNTANQNAFFGICFYPTPVPEPATLAILGLGAVVLLRKRK